MRSASELDVVIIGSGFAGSLTAAILQSHGLRTALIDRSRHPRFAIGESSTPTANLILSDIAEKHGFDWLRPFCKYGSWRQTYPLVTCGLKRGFTYFRHQPGSHFEPDVRHSNELLVAASATDASSDTQWLRADVDAFFFEQAQSLGALTFEESEVRQLARTAVGWDVHCETVAVAQRLPAPLAPLGRGAGGEGQSQTGLTSPTPTTLRCRFVIDASGSKDVLCKQLALPSATDQLATHSRSLFGHFVGLPRWEDFLIARLPSATADYPFHCDDAALHHVLDEGWMWWIRFSNDVTSVGLTLDEQRFPLPTNLSAEEEWGRVLSAYPSLAELLGSARHVDPPGRLIRTGRLQRLVARCAGDGWALLPHTAGFIDPLHSTGIAHSLAGVDRLTTALLADWDRPMPLADALANYERKTLAELKLIDQFVSGGYEAIRLKSFRKFVAFSMTYFAAATTWERRRVPGSSECCPPLFCVDDPPFCNVVAQLRASLSSRDDASFESLAAELLKPFNSVGLFAPPIPNMYDKTALE